LAPAQRDSKLPPRYPDAPVIRMRCDMARCINARCAGGDDVGKKMSDIGLQRQVDQTHQTPRLERAAFAMQ